ncbi:hypothetical protein [Epilithonimonas lactis]|uniref:hypothetical protein n=1 Tax=Epilithonimonas lactis TaxID=421072 RepID=UPI00103940FF|nr:hypothetical protein [Epilithonimonas lactis]
MEIKTTLSDRSCSFRNAGHTSLQFYAVVKGPFPSVSRIELVIQTNLSQQMQAYRSPVGWVFSQWCSTFTLGGGNTRNNEHIHVIFDQT